ncbi:manganese efflux pump [Clostridium senegalense]|uniref:manganese efflux pump n=1 Tax=Clostridium senegalense TaxID=1465809 RepID=UPI000289B1FD|nr:manganese efflux pump [Clostridium senegalense]MBU5226138.1 manganese efflux pump MntP family protein [Clostridium senegalense]
MSIIQLVWIAIAVGLDASAVAFGIGLNEKVEMKDKCCLTLSFGFFQFLFSFIGGSLGKTFSDNIITVPTIISGMVIAIVGIMMIKEGMENQGEYPLLSGKIYFIIGISVSIDAMVVGFITLINITYGILMIYSLIIGSIALIMSIISFIISKYLGRINLIGKYANYIGGVILILFGLKMIFL